MIKAKLFGSTSVEASEPTTDQNYKETSWRNLQCSNSAQIPSQDNLDDSHRFLSLYTVKWNGKKTQLYIYDGENQIEEVKNLGSELILDRYTSITQLPNGELFCYGGIDSGITVIIDRSYGVRMLPSGIPCIDSSALYFDDNIYCFGGESKAINRNIPLSRKFDLKNNRWIDLARLPNRASHCHSLILNGNILISSEYCKNLWLYSIEIDSFSTIPHDFDYWAQKFLINVERLYLIERCFNGLVYEGEDEYHWKQILQIGIVQRGLPDYCLYNKGKIYMCGGRAYFQFDLKDKVFQFL